MPVIYWRNEKRIALLTSGGDAPGINAAIGAVTPRTLLLASRLGAAAADHLLAGNHGVLIGMQRSEITATPLGEIHGKQKRLDLELFRLAQSFPK